jgi:hypothetical protein
MKTPRVGTKASRKGRYLFLDLLIPVVIMLILCSKTDLFTESTRVGPLPSVHGDVGGQGAGLCESLATHGAGAWLVVEVGLLVHGQVGG